MAFGSQQQIPQPESANFPVFREQRSEQEESERLNKAENLSSRESSQQGIAGFRAGKLRQRSFIHHLFPPQQNQKTRRSSSSGNLQGQQPPAALPHVLPAPEQFGITRFIDPELHALLAPGQSTSFNLEINLEQATLQQQATRGTANQQQLSKHPITTMQSSEQLRQARDVVNEEKRRSKLDAQWESLLQMPAGYFSSKRNSSAKNSRPPSTRSSTSSRSSWSSQPRGLSPRPAKERWNEGGKPSKNTLSNAPSNTKLSNTSLLPPIDEHDTNSWFAGDENVQLRSNTTTKDFEEDSAVDADRYNYAKLVRDKENLPIHIPGVMTILEDGIIVPDDLDILLGRDLTLRPSDKTIADGLEMEALFAEMRSKYGTLAELKGPDPFTDSETATEPDRSFDSQATSNSRKEKREINQLVRTASDPSINLIDLEDPIIQGEETSLSRFEPLSPVQSQRREFHGPDSPETFKTPRTPNNIHHQEEFFTPRQYADTMRGSLRRKASMLTPEIYEDETATEASSTPRKRNSRSEMKHKLRKGPTLTEDGYEIEITEEDRLVLIRFLSQIIDMKHTFIEVAFEGHEYIAVDLDDVENAMYPQLHIDIIEKPKTTLFRYATIKLLQAEITNLQCAVTTPSEVAKQKAQDAYDAVSRFEEFGMQDDPWVKFMMERIVKLKGYEQKHVETENDETDETIGTEEEEAEEDKDEDDEEEEEEEEDEDEDEEVEEAEEQEEEGEIETVGDGLSDDKENY